MRPFFPLLVSLVCNILVLQLFVVDASQSVAVITLQNRRINGHTFKTFSSPSLITCGLHCARSAHCVSTNFKSTQPNGQGVCELNDQGIAWPADEKDLEYEEGVFFTQYQSIQVRLFCTAAQQTSRRHNSVEAISKYLNYYGRATISKVYVSCSFYNIM